MYVKVPKDINEYEHKVFKGLTWRNIKWGGIGIALSLSLYFILSKFIDSSILSWFLMIIVAPCFLFGFITFDGIPGDKYALIVMNYYLGSKRTKYENDYDWEKHYQQQIRKDGESNVGKKAKKKRRKKIKEIDC